MTTEEQLAHFIKGAEAGGLDMDHASTPAGVVFRSEKTARIFAKQHAKEVVPVGDRWLAKTRSKVTVVFGNGNTRHFPAVTAIQRGGILVVPAGNDEMPFHFEEVATVTITDEDGLVVEAFDGPAKSRLND